MILKYLQGMFKRFTRDF